METTTKCLHETCGCPALPLQDYCCDECQIAATAHTDKPLTECQCHHANCGGETEMTPEGLLLASEVLASA